MGIQLVSPISAPERLMAYGGTGAGKSNAVLQVARKCPNSTFHYVDTDYPSLARLLDTDFTDLSNVVGYEPNGDDWEDVRDTIIKASDACVRDDWLVVDMLSQPWTTVQEWFTMKVHGVDHADYFLQLRIQHEAAKSKTPVNMDQSDDRWTVINGQWGQVVKAIRRCKGHVYVACEQVKVEQKSTYEKKEDKLEFGPYMYRPRGNKRLPHALSTIILMEKRRNGSWVMTTVKDRGRPEMEDVEVNDFAVQYLMKVAGWKPVVSTS